MLPIPFAGNQVAQYVAFTDYLRPEQESTGSTWGATDRRGIAGLPIASIYGNMDPMVRSFLTLLFLAAASLGVAAEGVIIVQKQENLKSGTENDMTLYMGEERVAADMAPDGKRMGFAYLGDQGLMRMVQHDQKIYREMTEADVKKIADTMNDAMAKLQEQMKNMPPQQRAMMEKMMGGRMKEMQAAAQKTDPTVYKRGDGSAEMAGRSCDWYEGYKGETMVSLVCAADWKEFDATAQDFAVFRKMADFFGKLVPNQSDQIAIGSEDWEERGMFPGVPLETTIFSDGKPIYRTTLKDYRRGEIPSDAFEAPEGYKKMKGFQPGG